MAHVSLIVPVSLASPLRAEQMQEHRRALEEAGHEVELLVVEGPHPSRPAASTGPEDAWRVVWADEPGLSAGAVAGMKAARGDLLLVLDGAMGYSPRDLVRVLEPLLRGEADLAVATRLLATREGSLGAIKRGILARCVGACSRPSSGITDPLSGLVGLRRAEFRAIANEMRPVGSKFALELKARCQGRWLEVAVGAPWPARWGGLEFGDLRQLKRMADLRFGNASRLVQFCGVGASGMVVDLSFYAALQWVFARTSLAHQTAPLVGRLDLAAAGALAIWVALTWNFLLNRRLTFSYARQGSLPRQYITYAWCNALSIALSFSLRLVLPRNFEFFDQHKLAAAVVGIVAATGLSFTMSRWVVFRHRASPPAGDAAGSAQSLELNPEVESDPRSADEPAFEPRIGRAGVATAGDESAGTNAGAGPLVHRLLAAEREPSAGHGEIVEAG